MTTIDPVALSKALISCDSVTPAGPAVFDVLADALAGAGFGIDRFIAGKAPDGPVENMLAVRGSGAPHVAFAGHLDVVPPGSGWTLDPFGGEELDGLLYGRGAVDMKGAVAAFAAAASCIPEHAGTVSLIITGDEEGPAIFGTRALIDRMADRKLDPDLCIVGEPTSVARLGDTIKIGRRGIGQHLDHRAGQAGPRRLPAPCRQSDPQADRDPARCGSTDARSGHRLVPAVQHRDHRISTSAIRRTTSSRTRPRRG